MVVESVKVSEGPSQSQLAVTESAPLGPVANIRPPLKRPRPRSRRSAKWGLEDNTACYGQEKNKISVSIAICLVRLSLTPLKLQLLFENKVRNLYSYSVMVILPPCVFPHYGYTTRILGMTWWRPSSLQVT